MNLLSIPEEVIEGSVLPYLKWNDLLRFRRVCRATKEITQGYMKVHPELAPEIEIGEDDAKRSFEAFLNMNIPTNRIFLNNPSGFEFYEKDQSNVVKFLKKCGPLVKHLRVKQFSLYICGKELDFMEALTNLQSLEAEYFGVGKNVSSAEDLRRVVKEKRDREKQDPRSEIVDCPTVFYQLKSLRTGQQDDLIIGNITNSTAVILKTCELLEHVSMPYNSQLKPTPLFTLPEGYEPRRGLATAFSFIDTTIEERARESPDKPNLKIFDFCCYHDETYLEVVETLMFGSEMFLELLGTCIKYGVQLDNVDPVWFNQWGYRPERSSPDLGIPVLSLVNLNPAVFPVNMTNLERIEIRATSKSTPGQQWREERPDWPALKSVDITVDSKDTYYLVFDDTDPTENVFREDTKVIFQFFFQDIRRTNVIELRLHFTKESGQVAVPRTADIVESCPNLKKITIIKWPGMNKPLIKLWDGLPALEEITLDSCYDVGNMAFVGVDTKNPVFFKLKRLTKLSLKGLDQMPKITDLLFSLVLRHLNLTHLTLTSDRPLNSVTSAGILCLLEGNFAQEIENFPFQDWSLEGVSAREFKKMEAKFRSFNML